MNRESTKKAFSLIELSIVILIIGIIIAGVTQSSRMVAAFRLSAAKTQTNSSPVSSITSVVMWLEATSDKSFLDIESEDQSLVSTWNDIGQYFLVKNNAVQPTVLNRPKYILNCINKLPCVRFDGAASYLKFDGTPIVGVEYTVFVVEQRSSNKASNYFIGGSSIAGDAQLILGYRGNGTFTFAQHADDYDASVPLYSSPTNPVIHVVTRSSTNKSYSRNGTLATLTPINGGNMTSPLTSYPNATIGDYGNNALFYSGDIGEIIMFNRALKYEERKAVEAYLSKKWQIPVS